MVRPSLHAELAKRGVTAVMLQDSLFAGEDETFLMQLRSNLERLGRLLPVNP